MLCAGAGSNKSTCKGDSGGPLTVEVNKRAFLIGATSFGRKDPNSGAACNGQYTVFANIANLRDWIVKTMHDNDGTIGSGCAGERFSQVGQPTKY